MVILPRGTAKFKNEDVSSMTPTLVWMRLFASVLTAVNFGVISLALILFLNRNDIGHRALIRMVIIFCSMVCGDNIFGAWNVYHHHREAFAFIRFGTSMFGTMVVVYFMIVNRDVVRTLRISELWDRLRRDRLADGEQARLNMVYTSEQTRYRSESILARTKM